MVRWRLCLASAFLLHGLAVAALLASASLPRTAAPQNAPIELTLEAPPAQAAEALPPDQTPTVPTAPPAVTNAGIRPPTEVVPTAEPEPEASATALPPRPATSAQRPAEAIGPPPVPGPGFRVGPEPSSPPDGSPAPAAITPGTFTLAPSAPPSAKAERPAAPTRLAPLIITEGRQDSRLPAYPAAARQKREEGDVLLELQLDPAGRLQSARVKTSSGHASLDDAALRSVQSLRFRIPPPAPGIVLHNLILVEIPFSFRLAAP